MELERVIEACREAGDAARALHGSDIITKADGSPVTAADMRANEVLTLALTPSGLPIVSEETKRIPPHDSGKAWIIDPLDGTSSFITNDPGWAVMAGLVENGTPVMGVVYAPELHVLWCAEKGKGAFVERNGKRTKISVTAISDPHEATMLLSIHHASDDALTLARQLGAKERESSGLGIKACTVAEGAAELYWTKASLGEWDACAPHIIVQEAGGAFSDARGNEIRYGSLAPRAVKGIAASNAALHARLIQAGKTVLGN